MTTDILLSIPDLFLTMGLPSIDESLDKLLVAMESFPKAAILGDTVGYARVLGLLLALCVGSYECWLMMLGRRCRYPARLWRLPPRQWPRPRTRRLPPWNARLPRNRLTT